LGLSGAAIVVSSAAPSFCLLSRTVAFVPTQRTTLHAAYVRVCLTYRACLRQHDADLKLISAGRGDVPLRDLRFRCTNCRGRLS
jgi:hypothetical protein